MVFAAYLTLFTAGLALAAPVHRRVVAELNEEATAEAHQRDDTATRAFTASVITTSDGRCLSVDPLGGDFRANLIPIQLLACDGSANQQWDVITAGKHNNKANAALVVSTLTNGCLNFDPRRAAGNQVNIFSCGGRAAGEGIVTDSQLFEFTGGAGPLALAPLNGANAVCLTPNNNLLDQAACNADAPGANQVFLIGAGGGAGGGGGNDDEEEEEPAVTSSVAAGPTDTPDSPDSPDSPDTPDEEECPVQEASTSFVTITVAQPTATACAPPVTVTVTANPSAVTTVASSSAAAPTSPAPGPGAPSAEFGPNINLEAAAEAHKRDETATRALTGSQIKTSDGKCLSIDPNAGDFRLNLIPINIADCDGSINQQFDVLTSGIHNNVAGAALIVSTLTQGCFNFDGRRAAGNQVLLFSCGGRADGSGEVNNSQLFPFTAGQNGPIPLTPLNAQGSCLVPNGNLDIATCNAANASGDELFTFVP